MLFVAIIGLGAGYLLLYAAVKGDKYTVGGVPVWRRPWLPLVDLFTGGSGGTTSETGLDSSVSLLQQPGQSTTGQGAPQTTLYGSSGSSIGGGQP